MRRGMRLRNIFAVRFKDALDVRGIHYSEPELVEETLDEPANRWILETIRFARKSERLSRMGEPLCPAHGIGCQSSHCRTVAPGEDLKTQGFFPRFHRKTKLEP